jgi:Flp pilus assembly protein TadG
VKLRRRLWPEERGAAAIEMAFALPTMVMMLWAFVQLAQVYRATAGIQQGLGQGARYATLCTSASTTGACTSPDGAAVKTKIENSVDGIGPGTFTVLTPVVGTSGGAYYYDLTVCYSQPTSLLIVPGPTVRISRSKRVWIASTTVSATSSTEICPS